MKEQMDVWMIGIAMNSRDPAHIVGAEEAYGPNTAHTELVLAGLVAGCAVIVSVCLFAEAEPSWPFMAAIFAATQLIALVAVVRRA